MRKKKSPTVALRHKVVEVMAQGSVNKSGPCTACGELGYRCSDRIEAAHIIGRGEWCIAAHPLNIIPLCNIHHRYYTMHQLDWDEFIERKFPGRKQELLDYRTEHRDSREKIDWERWKSFWEPIWKRRLDDPVPYRTIVHMWNQFE